MNNVINFVGFQLVWIAAVFGAANNLVWPALVLVAIFALWQLHPARRHANDWRVLLYALPIGFISDSAWQALRLIEYAANPINPAAPFWIMTLWVAFALTFNHSLGWLKHRPLMALLFGLVGSPLSYWAGSRIGALNYLTDPLLVSAVFGVSWAAIVWFLTQQSAYKPFTAATT